MPSLSLHPQDVLTSLEATGAALFSFNPATATALSKLLLKVAEAEGRALSMEAASGLAQVADGDIRNALQTLQVFFGAAPPAAQPAAAPAKKVRSCAGALA